MVFVACGGYRLEVENCLAFLPQWPTPRRLYRFTELLQRCRKRQSRTATIGLFRPQDAAARKRSLQLAGVAPLKEAESCFAEVVAAAQAWLSFFLSNTRKQITTFSGFTTRNANADLLELNVTFWADRKFTPHGRTGPRRAKYRGLRPARAGWGSKTRKCQKTQNFAWEMVLDHFLGHVGSVQILTPMGGRHRGEAARGNFEDVFRGRLRAVPRTRERVLGRVFCARMWQHVFETGFEGCSVGLERRFRRGWVEKIATLF